MTSEPLGTYDPHPIREYLAEHFPNKKPAWVDRPGASKDSSVKAKLSFRGFTLEIPIPLQELFWYVQKLFGYESKLDYACVTDEAQQKAIRQEVHQLSGDLLLEALDTAAQATSRLLGPKTDDYGFRANLMLPVNWEVLDSPFFMDDSTGRRNKERADHLWQHTNQ